MWWLEEIVYAISCFTGVINVMSFIKSKHDDFIKLHEVFAAKAVDQAITIDSFDSNMDHSTPDDVQSTLNHQCCTPVELLGNH